MSGTRIIEGDFHGTPYRFEVRGCTPGSWVGIDETGTLVEKMECTPASGVITLQQLQIIDLPTTPSTTT